MVRYTLQSSADAGTQVSTVVQSEHIISPCYASESLIDTLGLINAPPTPFSPSAVSAGSHMKNEFHADAGQQRSRCTIFVGHLNSYDGTLAVVGRNSRWSTRQ